VLLKTDAGGTTTARYTLAPFGYGDLVSQRRPGASSWYHYVALGSTRALTDSGGNVTDTAVYQAVGRTCSVALDSRWRRTRWVWQRPKDCWGSWLASL